MVKEREENLQAWIGASNDKKVGDDDMSPLYAILTKLSTQEPSNTFCSFIHFVATRYLKATLGQPFIRPLSKQTFNKSRLL